MFLISILAALVVTSHSFAQTNNLKDLVLTCDLQYSHLKNGITWEGRSEPLVFDSSERKRLVQSPWRWGVTDFYKNWKLDTDIPIADGFRARLLFDLETISENSFADRPYSVAQKFKLELLDKNDRVLAVLFDNYTLDSSSDLRRMDLPFVQNLVSLQERPTVAHVKLSCTPAWRESPL